ncbi:DnaJ C-terminal domain-containing protein [Kitasatospora sp. NPDC048545]|uniref:DnaJ C-terminal domain-containing protein n=1 Tax=Kitasatospora sp. NPDC048545 TaxID=3157208 RepID=UPI00340A7CCA
MPGLRRRPEVPCQGWCPTCRSSGRGSTQVREHQIRIPAGVREGQRLRLRGLGSPGINGGEPGDLYATVHIEP